METKEEDTIQIGASSAGETGAKEERRWIKELEDALLRAEFDSVFELARPVLKGGLDLAKAATSKIEIEPHAKQEVSLTVQVAALSIQSLFESDATNVAQDDLLLLERFLKQNGPLPFELVIMWLNFRLSLGHHEYVKELLETFMGKYAERVKRGGIATPVMSAQYSTLAYLYTVQTLPRLGEVEGAQKFLAIHNNSMLLSREKRQEFLHCLSVEIALRQKEGRGSVASEDGTLTNSNRTNPGPPPVLSASVASDNRGPTSPNTPTSVNGGVGNDPQNVSPSRDKKTKPTKPLDDAALVITKDQATYLVVGTVAATVLISQRTKIVSTVSSVTSFLGNLLFSNT